MSDDTAIAVSKLGRHPLHEGAVSKILELIREHSLWGSYLPPERELARLFGVSRGTLRKGLDVLEERGVVARRKRQGTLVVAEAQPGAERTQARVAVASFVRVPRHGYYGMIMAGLSDGACDADWNVSFFTGLAERERWERFAAAVRDREIDGLVLLAVSKRAAAEKVLECWKGPTVLVDHHFPDLPVTGVMDDSEGGARRVTEHLLSMGHSRIAYIDDADPETNPWRYDGYAAALRGAGIEPAPELHLRRGWGAGHGRSAALELLDLPEPPTALLACDPERARGAWAAIEERGLEVGADFALACCGEDSDPSRFPGGLTGVSFRPSALGEIAVRELDEEMAGRAEAGRVVLVPTELIARGSSGGRLARGSERAGRGVEA